MDLPLLPADVALDEEPFTDEDLDLAIAVVDRGVPASRGAEAMREVVRLQPFDDLPGSADLDEDQRPAVERAVRWRPIDDKTAEWAARKWRAAKARQDEVIEQAAEWIRLIQTWMETQRRGPERSAAFFAAVLEDYGIRQRLDHDRKTITLPSATIRTRPVAAKPVVVDGKEQEFITWARLHLPELVREKPVPALSEFGEHLRVEEVVDHYEWIASYECDHTQQGVVSVEEVNHYGAVEPLILTTCQHCEPDAIDGAPERMIVEAKAWPVTRLAVIAVLPGEPAEGEDDDAPTVKIVEPPGLTVEPAKTNATVSA